VPSITSPKTHGEDATATALLLKTIYSPTLPLHTTTSSGAARVAGQPVKPGSLITMSVLKVRGLALGVVHRWRDGNSA
jgi:hypothetical protein